MPRFRHFQTSTSLTQDVNNVDIVGAILSSCGSSLLSRSLVGQVGKQSKTTPAFSVAFACFRVKFAQLARKNRVLEIENVVLKNQVSTTRSDMDFVQGELQVFRDRSFGLMENEHKHVAEADQYQQIIKSLEMKIEQYGEFIRTLVDLKLDNPVKRAALSVMNDEDFEEALVNAVQAACQNKSSAWSRIVPAITGPRSPENYMSVLNLTLRARKDLRERTKKSDFWKSKARMIPENADLVTPSSSLLSDFCDESAQAMAMTNNSSPPPVLENILDTLKRGQSWPPREEASDPSKSKPSQPLLLDSMEKDLISESSSILSEEIRNSLKLLPVRSEEMASPLGILKNGTTTVTISGNSKDALSPRIVRFAPQRENAIIMRPSSIDSTSSSLLYVSGNTDVCVPGDDATEDKRHETGFKEDNEFSGTESVLSDVYADFLNESEVDGALAGQAHTFVDTGGSSERANGNEESSAALADQDTHYDSSGSEYSESEMCDDEDFVLQGPLGERSAREDACKTSFTPAPASSFTLPASDRSQAYNRVKGKGVAGHRNLPSIEEQDIVDEEPHAVQPKSAALSEVVNSDRSSTDVRERSIMADSVDATPTEPLNKRYGRVTLSAVTPKTDDVLQSHGSPTSVIPCSSSRGISPSIMMAAAPLHVDKGAPEKQATSSSSSVDVPVRHAAEGKHVNVDKATVPQESSAQSSMPVTPTRRRLVPPRSVIPKRPVLQQVNINTLVTPPLTDDGTAKSDVQRVSVRPSAKELGKRRGVIMVEKQDIIAVVRNSSVVGHTRSNSWDNSISTKSSSPSLGHPGPSSRPDANHKENVSKSTRALRRVQKPTSAPITPTRPPRTGPRAPMMLSELEQSLKHISAKAGIDVSRFDSNVAELLDSMSSSDLGSLEPSEPDDPDSDCEILHAVQNDAQESVRNIANSSNIRKVLPTSGTGNKSSAVAPRTLRKAASTSSSTSAESISGACLDASRRLRPPGPRAGSKNYPSAPVVAASYSASSSESSGPSSFCVESPTLSRISYRDSRFGCAGAPVRLDKLSPISSKMILPAERDIALSTLRHKQPEAGPTRFKFPPSPPPPSTPSSSVKTPFTPIVHGVGKVKAGMESSSKASPSPSKPSGVTKSHSPSPQLKINQFKAALPITHPQPKPWPGISGKVSPSQAKSKATATPATSCNPTGLPQQTIPKTPPSPSVLNNKPRANTINTISPLPSRYHTPINLTPDSPTKPRSNTVNSISPHGRSPLSQNVVNVAVEFQSRLNRAPPLPKHANEASAQLPSSLGTKIAQATRAKSTAPLQIVKKGVAVGKARETRPLPPTAAFMRPALSPPTPTIRRISTSVAPLIPNWGSRDGGLSASQARSMLRSNNVSMR